MLLGVVFEIGFRYWGSLSSNFCYWGSELNSNKYTPEPNCTFMGGLKNIQRTAVDAAVDANTNHRLHDLFIRFGCEALGTSFTALYERKKKARASANHGSGVFVPIHIKRPKTTRIVTRTTSTSVVRTVAQATLQRCQLDSQC